MWRNHTQKFSSNSANYYLWLTRAKIERLNKFHSQGYYLEWYSSWKCYLEETQNLIFDTLGRILYLILIALEKKMTKLWPKLDGDLKWDLEGTKNLKTLPIADEKFRKWDSTVSESPPSSWRDAPGLLYCQFSRIKGIPHAETVIKGYKYSQVNGFRTGLNEQGYSRREKRETGQNRGWRREIMTGEKGKVIEREKGGLKN